MTSKFLEAEKLKFDTEKLKNALFNIFLNQLKTALTLLGFITSEKLTNREELRNLLRNASSQ